MFETNIIAGNQPSGDVAQTQPAKHQPLGVVDAMHLASSKDSPIPSIALCAVASDLQICCPSSKTANRNWLHHRRLMAKTPKSCNQNYTLHEHIQAMRYRNSRQRIEGWNLHSCAKKHKGLVLHPVKKLAIPDPKLSGSWSPTWLGYREDPASPRTSITPLGCYHLFSLNQSVF